MKHGSYQTKTLYIDPMTMSTLTRITEDSNECATKNREDEPLFSKQPRKQDLLPLVLKHSKENHWETVEKLLELDPSLSRRQTTMVCQGETSPCLLIHFMATKRGTPMNILDTLVTLNPSSLLSTEPRGGRLPLHLAILKGSSYEKIRYLCNANQKALQVRDLEGNYPLHYASMHGNSETLRLLVEIYPQACQVANGRDRMPLHLVCSRCFDTESLDARDVQAILNANPKATQVSDRFGRLPLHLAAQVPSIQWRLLELLISRYPEALLHKDKARRTPLQLAKSNAKYGNPTKQHDLIVTSMAECTLRERRKSNPFLPSFLAKSPLSRKPNKVVKVENDLHNCYG